MRFRSPRTNPLHAVRSFVGRIVSQFQAAAFWTAVLLPFGYAAVLFGSGSLVGIGALFAVHVACLLVGHSHHRSGDAVGAKGGGV